MLNHEGWGKNRNLLEKRKETQYLWGNCDYTLTQQKVIHPDLNIGLIPGPYSRNLRAFAMWFLLLLLLWNYGLTHSGIINLRIKMILVMRKWRLQTDSESLEVFILFIKRRNITPHRPHNQFVFELKFSKLTGGGVDGGRPGREASLPT